MAGLLPYDLARLIAQSRRSRRKSITLRPIEPTSVLEDELRRAALAIVRVWRERAQELIVNRYHQGVDGLVRDGIVSDVEAALASIAAEANGLRLRLTPSLRNWVVRIERWHAGKFAAAIKAGARLDVLGLITSQAAAPEVEAYLSWASGLIRDLSSDTRKRLESAVLQAVTQGKPRRELAKDIAKELGISRRRGLRIAQDQTAKLVGKLDELRQREAGLDEYRWRHSRKQNYRPHHVAREGKIYSWDNPPYDGHPKTQPYCGCTAQAYIPLLGEVEARRGEGGELQANPQNLVRFGQ